MSSLTAIKIVPGSIGTAPSACAALFALREGAAFAVMVGFEK
jgi:hypothetical protein